MAVAQPISYGFLWRKYRVSIIFPILAISSIYADYSHTQKYKQSKALALSKSEELKN